MRRFVTACGAMTLAAALAGGAILAAPAPSAPTQRTPSAHVAGPLRLTLDPASQTLLHLSPTSEPGFDFAPGDRAAERRGDGYAQIGDLHLRLRMAGSAGAGAISPRPGGAYRSARFPPGARCWPAPT